MRMHTYPLNRADPSLTHLEARPTFSLLHNWSSDIAPSFSVLVKPHLLQMFQKALASEGSEGLKKLSKQTNHR
jgi:hypothetical protein